MELLIVDDEKKMTDALTERLRLRGFGAIPAYDGKSALEEIEKHHFDGMILDLRLPDADGFDILMAAKELSPPIKVVILSGHGTEQEFQRCMENGAVGCFHKPAKIADLVSALTG